MILWLPTVAALAVFSFSYWHSPKLVFKCSIVFILLCYVLCVNDSFGFIPVHLRVEGIRLLDNQYTLQPPDCGDDILPLDTRQYPVHDVEEFVARDASAHGAKHIHIRATISVLTSMLGHDYLNLIGRSRSDYIDFFPWYYCDLNSNCEYIICPIGYERLSPGDCFINYYPELPADVQSGKIDNYVLAGAVNSLESTKVLIFRRK